MCIQVVSIYMPPCHRQIHMVLFEQGAVFPFVVSSFALSTLLTMSFGNTPVPPLPPRLLFSQEWTEYVMRIKSSSSSSLMHLDSLWLRPNPNSRRPLYRTMGGSRVHYVHYGIPDSNGVLQDEGWTLSEREHGPDQKVTILATLSIGRKWPAVNDTWQLMPSNNYQQSSFVVEVISEIEYNRLCDTQKYNLDSDDQVQLQNTLVELNKRVGTLQENQKSLADNCDQIASVVQKCQSQCSYLVNRMIQMEKHIAKVQQSPCDRGIENLDDHHKKCTCSTRRFQSSDKLSSGDIIEVFDEKSGLFDTMTFDYYNKATRSVKVRGLKSSKSIRPRYVRMELVYTYKVCTNCIGAGW